MTFLLLCIQSTVSVLCVITAKRMRFISFRDLDAHDAKMWFPISFMLVSVIYTGSKSLVSACSEARTYLKGWRLMSVAQQYLSIPVYTIFKNLTIILIVSSLHNTLHP